MGRIAGLRGERRVVGAREGARGRRHAGAPAARERRLSLATPMDPGPPSAGATETEPLVRIVDAPIDAGAVVSAVAGHDAGAVAVFLGTVRETAQGRRVLFLQYEAYAPMAESRMRDIALALGREIGPCRVASLHRVGRVEVAE